MFNPFDVTMKNLVEKWPSAWLRFVVVLQRKEADQVEITGRVECFRLHGTCYLHFDCDVVRVWEIPVEQILQGEIGILPLAPISLVSEGDLPEVLRRMEESGRGRSALAVRPEEADVPQAYVPQGFVPDHAAGCKYGCVVLHSTPRAFQRAR
jgi:hypothetical protein